MSTTSTFTRVMACPAHAPACVDQVPFDDGRGTCDVCGATGYHVAPYNVPPGILVGWAKWWKVTVS